MVNTRKEVEATGSVTVTFMGAEGSSVAVECPKVCNKAALEQSILFSITISFTTR